MAGVQQLLRKAAIEKMASPEQLDMSMRVTSPVSWLALATCGAMVTAAVIASVVFPLNVKVQADGMMIRGAAIMSVEAKANGTISEILVTNGDLVEKGQAVALLDQDALRLEIETTQRKVDGLERQVGGDRRLRNVQKSNVRAQITALRREMEAAKDLVARGLKTNKEVLNIESQIREQQSRLASLDLPDNAAETQLISARSELDALKITLESSGEIRSEYAGRVDAILEAPGSVIAAGRPLLNLSDPEAPVNMVLFIPLAEGKKVLKDMVVRISPSTVKPEEHGMILARVATVSSQPSTRQEVANIFGNNTDLVNKYQESTPFQATATPELNPQSPSGFQWTSGLGPPHAIDASTPITAQIVVETRLPISYVIPTIKKTLGVGG